MPSTGILKATHSSTVSQNKKAEKLSQKPRRKTNQKKTPAALSSKTKTPVVPLLDNITGAPHEGSGGVAQSCSSFQLTEELPPANTIRLHESNPKDQCSQRHLVSMPNSVTVLNQLSDRNTVTNAIEGLTSTQRHRCFTGHHGDNIGYPHQEFVNQSCEHNTQTVPTHCPSLISQKQAVPQVSNIERNCTPGHIPHNVTCTQEAPAVLQTNQRQNTFSRQLFPPRPNASCSQPSCSVPHPSIHPRGNINVGCCNHSRVPFGSNTTTFHSQMTCHPVQQAHLCCNCHNVCHKTHHVTQSLPTRGLADVANLPFTQHFQQANTVQHYVHYINPSISNSLAGSVGHHTFQNQQSGETNILPPGRTQGISDQGTANPQISSYNKHVSQSTQQQNSRGQAQHHTVFLPFYGNTPLEIEIK
ncbi:uncharacterized protein LOC126354614 isoform X2 [Schistocerca gregaria]|nr:uncharacterized protein LOC126354614 isoform X2 [Schistocerca gregaria]